MRQQGRTKVKECEHRWTLIGTYRCSCGSPVAYYRCIECNEVYRRHGGYH